MSEALRRGTLAVAALLVIGAFGWALYLAQAPAEGPVPIAWDEQACAHCRMLIGDPAFAAQIQTRDGRVLDFDDPGCLLAFAAESPVEARAVWFHHAREPRWVPEARVVFAPVSPTPMGYGLGAFERDEVAGLEIEAARRHVQGELRSREYAP